MCNFIGYRRMRACLIMSVCGTRRHARLLPVRNIRTSVLAEWSYRRESSLLRPSSSG